MLFTDRFEAGRLLASRLTEFANRNDVVVLALPRGGVPVGYEAAKALRAPLDVFVVRKLGVPGQEELAMGALASGGITVLNRNVVQAFRISQATVDAVASREANELQRREREYRDGRPAVEVREWTVILVDDGLATGSSMRVAATALRKKSPSQIVVAVPVAAPSTCAEFEIEVDKVICAVTPEPFWAVGQWYRDFSQTSDEEVRELLRRAAEFSPPKSGLDTTLNDSGTSRNASARRSSIHDRSR
jgi:putative phosphoribosyl transferase